MSSIISSVIIAAKIISATKYGNNQIMDIETSFVSGVKAVFENTYCNCTAKHSHPPWCEKWSSYIKESYCVLNGVLRSQKCPGATPLEHDGQIVDDYYSSDSSVCSKASRKKFGTIMRIRFKYYSKICLKCHQSAVIWEKGVS